MVTSVIYSPSPPLPGLDLVERQCGCSARGSRPRWSDRWNSEKRKRRRASTHTKQCSPKAKAPRCRRTARHEKSKHRNVNYCVFFSRVSFFPSCALLFAGLASERRFPPSENGIEWTALSPRHSFPQPRYCCLCLLLQLSRSPPPNLRAVWRCLEPRLSRVLADIPVVSSEEITITSPCHSLHCFLCCALEKLRFYFPPVLPGYCIKLIPSVSCCFFMFQLLK